MDKDLVRLEGILTLHSKCTNSVLTIRHGALLRVAEAVLSLGLDINGWNDESRTELAELVPKIKNLRVYRGRGGEIIRSAGCPMIKCLSWSNIQLTAKEQVQFLDSSLTESALLLCKTAKVTDRAGKERDAKTRRNALQALSKIFLEVGFESSTDSHGSGVGLLL